MHNVKNNPDTLRILALWMQAINDPTVERLYALFKNMLNFFGFYGFEVELRKVLEGPRT